MPVISVTWEVGIRRIAIQGQPRQRVSKTLSEEISWLWWYVPMDPAMLEAEARGSRERHPILALGEAHPWG
jgi:hypothetical protein